MISARHARVEGVAAGLRPVRGLSSILLAAVVLGAFWGADRPLSAQAADELELPERDVPRPEPLDPPTFREPQFRRGDVDGDGVVNITDPIYGLEFLFKSGPRPPCMESANANDDSQLDISDSVFSLAYQFAGTAPPPAPGPFECGVDPGVSLGCESYELCPDELPLITHVLNRITFGPNLDLLTRIQSRADLVRYIEAQLDAPDDYDPAVHEPEIQTAVNGLDIGFRGWSPATANAQVQRVKAMLFVPAILSEYQLLHVVTQFWNNHFHTQIDTLPQSFFGRGGRGGGATRPTAAVFNAADTDSSGDLTEAEWEAFRALYPSVIRWNQFNRQQVDGIITQEEFASMNRIAYWKYRGGREQQGVAADMERREYDHFRRLAFGSFRELFEANTKSVAQLIYLNGFENTVLEPNENHAREFFELYGLGVDHIYTQRDIEEMAKVLTGWTVDWVRRADYAPDDINFVRNPSAPSVIMVSRNDLELPETRNWDDALYSWAFVFGHRNNRRFPSPMNSHDWNRKDLFLQRYGGVDSLGNPVAASDAISIPLNNTNRTVAGALAEFDLVLDRVTGFRDCAKFISTKLIQVFVTDDLSLLAKTRPMPAELEEKFDEVDLDSDELIDRSEWEEPIPLVLPNGRPPEIFDRLDADGNELVSKLEYQEPDLLLAAIDAWRDSGGSIREVLRAILLSDEFLSLKFYRAKVKTPFEVVASAMRALDATANEAQILVATEDVSLAGMELFNFGDPTGESELGFDWMHTTGLLERLKFINRGVNPATAGERRFLWNAGSLQAIWRLNSAERAVDFFSLLFYSGDILPEQAELAITAFASATPATRIPATVAFLMSLPQFQKQ